MKKIISFSLYGPKKMYRIGMSHNLVLAAKYFPDWTVRVYHDRLNPPKDWEAVPCEKVAMGMSLGTSGMFWRFVSAFDHKAQRVLFRDSDSRLSEREAGLVKCWEERDDDAHSIHDHEHHRSFPLFGGMWGIKTGVLSHQTYHLLLQQIGKHQQLVADMNWLEHNVWTKIKLSTLTHSSVKVKWPNIPIPPAIEFIGQQWDENNKPIRP